MSNNAYFFSIDMSKEIKDQVKQLLDVWLEAFNNRDLEGWSNTHNFPHVRLQEGKFRYGKQKMTT